MSTKRLAPPEFEECYQRYATGVLAFLRVRVGCDADADDCLGRIFEKLWTQGADVEPAARGAWLFVVARREAALHWRTKNRADEVLRSLAARTDDRTIQTTNDNGLDNEESAVELRLAMNHLTSEQRDILRRRFLDNTCFREIAEQLDIPLGTALSRVHAALKQLRKILRDD